MRITPWMLTMTTFVMVGAIAVLYLFKPPQRVPSGTLPPGTSFVNARAFAKPVLSPETREEHGGALAEPNGETTAVVSDDEPYTPQPPAGEATAEVTPDVVPQPGPVDPIDPMFDGNPEPDEPSFVTQQFRGGRRIDVTFRDGERVEVPRVSSAFGAGRAN